MKRNRRDKSEFKYGKNKDNTRGAKLYSIYSVTREGSRVPKGKPGNHRPLLSGDDLTLLNGGVVRPVRKQPAPPWATWKSAGVDK